MKGNDYPFVPLKGSNEWAKENYSVRGTPANFLLDAEGKIVFRPNPRSVEGQKKLEMEIAGLLARRAKK